RMKVPVLQRGQAFSIDVGAEACEHGLADDFAAFVDGDFDNFVAAVVGQLPRVDHGIGSRDRQSGTNLVAGQRPMIERSVGSACLRSVTQGRKRLSLGTVLS